MHLTELPDDLSVVRRAASDPVPTWAEGHGLAEGHGWAEGRGFRSITRTANELSIVCRSADVPEDERCKCPRPSLKGFFKRVLGRS